MRRKQFIKTLGAGAVFALTVPCIGGCTADSASSDPELESPSVANGKIDFTLDLDAGENAALKNNGGYVIVDGRVVVAKTITGSYVAASRKCAHQGNYQVIYENDGFSCSVHGATYDLTGKPTNMVTSNSLTVYKTSLNGSSLRVYE